MTPYAQADREAEWAAIAGSPGEPPPMRSDRPPCDTCHGPGDRWFDRHWFCGRCARAALVRLEQEPHR
jgi:hypothetical protein